MLSNNPITVFIVENDLDYVYLIKSSLKECPDIRVLGFATNAADAASMAEKLNPNIVLMDLTLTNIELDGVEVAKSIRLNTDAKIIILTATEEPRKVIDASKRSCASAYLFKRHYSTLIDTIRQTAQGYTPQECMILSSIINDLTPAERSVFFDYILGDKEIPLHLNKKTIDNQKSSVYHKLKIRGQKDALHIFENMIGEE